MKKYLLFACLALVLQIGAGDTVAGNVFKQYAKVIWIDQPKQVGVAYEHGEKLYEFPIMTGDDEKTTDPGIYVVKLKDENYYSKKYDVEMPFAIFFDIRERKAIHEGEVPPPEVKSEFATHGCIHVEQPYIERLFDWAAEGTTVVVIQGWRTEN